MLEELIHIAKEILVIVIAATMQLLASIGIADTNSFSPPKGPIAETPRSEHTLNTPPSPSERYQQSPSQQHPHTANDTPHAAEPATSTDPTDEQLQPEESTPPPPDVQPTDVLNVAARSALVNVFCTTHTGSSISASSGSGMIIDSRGIVLTNSHVAQYFLLEEEQGGTGYTDCIVRTGAPAERAYDAVPLFISSSWIAGNAEAIVQDRPLGTGEYDVALLLINESITDDPLPSSFPALSLRAKNDDIPEGLPMLVAGYPAEFLSGSAVSRELWPVTAVTHVLDVYTFGEHTADLFAVSGNIAAQQGSSGGGIVDITTGTLAGIVVTSSEGDTTSERELNAITPLHINHTLFTDTGMALSTYLSGNLKERADFFMENLAPELRDMLLDVIEG